MRPNSDKNSDVSHEYSKWEQAPWSTGLKPRPNDSNILIQHIPTLLAQHLQAPAKRLQHFNATNRSTTGRNTLRVFGHPVATCCDMLGIENRNSAHARVQHCYYTKLAKRPQHYASSSNVAWKIWPFSNSVEPTTPNIAQHLATGWPNARKMLRYVA